MYHVVSEKENDDIHIRCIHYCLVIPKNESEKFIESFKDNAMILGSYEDANDAHKKLYDITLERHKQYTKLLNSIGMLIFSMDGIPINIKPYICKYVLVFIDNDITLYPDIYSIPLYDYIILKSKFNSVRLATNEEMDNITVSKKVIIIRNDVINILNDLNITETAFVYNITNEEISKYNKINMEYGTIPSRILRCLFGDNGEALDELLKELPYTTNIIKNEQIKIVEDVKKINQASGSYNQIYDKIKKIFEYPKS
jgi:hypothetical protein